MSKEGKLNIKGVTRREFLTGLAAGGAAVSLHSGGLVGKMQPKSRNRVSLCIFSKHLQWLDYEGMAESAAEVGFDGVALTVRRGGHVLPERAEDDLPKAAEAVKKAGIEISMMTTSITDPDDPNTEKILRTASKLGIGYYRFGYWYYNEKTSIFEQLKEIKSKMRGLAEMNKQYRIFGGNQNHSGTRYFGASIWDTWELVKDLDPSFIGFQFDPQHAFTEGGGGSWLTDARLALSHTKMLALKTHAEWGNSEWKKSSRKRERKLEILTPDELKWYFRLLKKTGFYGPISTHYEFPGLGGVESGRRELKGITKKELFTIFRRNLKILKGMLSEANIL